MILNKETKYSNYQIIETTERENKILFKMSNDRNNDRQWKKILFEMPNDRNHECKEKCKLINMNSKENDIKSIFFCRDNSRRNIWILNNQRNKTSEKNEKRNTKKNVSR